jgi:hypothetical protein
VSFFRTKNPGGCAYSEKFPALLDIIAMRRCFLGKSPENYEWRVSFPYYYIFKKIIRKKREENGPYC